MKTVKIKYKRVIDVGTYTSDKLKFSHCTAMTNRVVKQVGEFETCRENIVSNLRSSVCKARYTELDLRRTRLIALARIGSAARNRDLATKRTAVDKQMLVSLKLVNHYERKLGWALTRLYKANNKSKLVYGKTIPRFAEPRICTYVVIGSKNWMRSPHYMSLYLLMLRLSRSGFKATFRSHKGLMRELEAFGGSVGSDDPKFVRMTYEKWDVFLENQKRLLGNRTMEDIYSLKSLHSGSDGYHEGVLKLLSGKSYDWVMGEKFAEICEANGIAQSFRKRPKNH